MRQPYSTITPAVVRLTARTVLQQALPCHPYGRKVTVACLLDLLLLVAALRSSLSAVVRRFRFGFSHETARQAVHANLPDVPTLTEALLEGLYRLGPRLLRRRWVVALDLHYSPFYGKRGTRGTVGGQKKQGTQRFYAYATAELVHRRHRYTVGLVALQGKFKPHEVVAALLAQLEARGLRLRGVVLDSGFDSGEVLLLLQERRLAYTVPLRRKGQGRNRRNDYFALPLGTVTTVQWVTEHTRRPVQTQAVVLRRRGEARVHVYAFGGWSVARAVSTSRAAAAARQARQWYRRRFGIETSYRQLNECKGRTTAKNVAYRLLLVGLALLLRQVWVWLTWQLARSRQARPKAWLGELPLQRLLAWLAEVIQRNYPEDKVIDLQQPLLWPEGLQP